MPRPPATCGSLTMYRKGCRCDDCRAAKVRDQQKFSESYKARHGADYRRKYDKPRGPREYSEAMRRRDGARRARLVGARVEYFDNAEVFERDGWVCGICSEKVDASLIFPDPLSSSLDHIVPVSMGGEHSSSNTRLAHLTCNIRRGAARGETVGA